MAFPEESSELEKQIGCMAGIFQIFDRGQLLTGRRNQHGQKRLPSGHASSNSKGNPVEQKKSSQQATLEKTLSKSLTENSSLSMESSRASCSSSSCSSFSSVNEVFFTEKPSKETLRPKMAPGCNDFRDIVKESINREVSLTVKTTPKGEIPKKMLKHRDSPRPLLLSKSMDGTYVIGIDRSIKAHAYKDECEPKCNSYYTSRFSCDGREFQCRVDMGHQDCTKTSMGFRDLPRLSLDSRKESLTRSNIDRNSSGNYDSPGHRRSNSLIARLMGLELFPDCAESGNVFTLEKLNPVESVINRRDHCLSNFSKRNMRENEVQNLMNPSLVVKTKTPVRIGTESAPWRQQEKSSKKMSSEIGKGLRELDLRAKDRLQTKPESESPRSFDSPIVIMKPVKHGKRTCSANSRHVTPIAGGVVGLHKIQTSGLQERIKPLMSSPKAIEREQGSKMKQSNRKSGVNSPRTPSSSSPRISQKKGDLDKNSCPSSPSSTNRNLVSDLGSPTSKFGPKSPQTKKNLGQKLAEVELANTCTPHLKEKISDKEMAVVSPVSVLDTAFYRDEMTPVKRLSDSFRDGEICTSEESWNPTSLPDTPPSNQIKSENIETLIQKLEQLRSASDELLSGDAIMPYSQKNKEYEYIHEILFASGLLYKDLNFVVSPQQVEHPINPDLFFVLEQTKSENKTNRKLIFDWVNEIIGQKLEPSISSMLSSEWFVCTKKVGGEQLLKELCTEVDKIQMGIGKRIEFDGGDESEGDDFEISREATIRQMKGWERHETELQGTILEIERLIFKDLVAEVIELESSEVINQRKIRRQLF